MPDRKVIANVTLSLDGRAAGADNDMSWLVRHAVHEHTAAAFAGLWRGVDTVLLGRNNFEGFAGYWPAVARDQDAPPRDRDLARWLDEVEKVVFSRTLTEAGWSNARIAGQDLETEVRGLKAADGRDILILSSLSIIRQLLAADLVDELRIALCPELLGVGPRLFDDDVPRTSWTLDGVTTIPTGALMLCYARAA